MVGLLGSRDSLLRLLEDNLAADIHVRGNRVTLRGSAGEVAFAERTIRELLALQESGSVITPDAVRRTIGMLADPAPSVTFDPGFGDSALGLTLNYQVAEFASQFRDRVQPRLIVHRRSSLTFWWTRRCRRIP